MTIHYLRSADPCTKWDDSDGVLRARKLTDDATEILERTRRIVERLMPSGPAPHGFYDPQGFVASSNRHSERERLFWRIKPRIAAKVKARRVLSDAKLHKLVKGHRGFVKDRRNG